MISPSPGAQSAELELQVRRVRELTGRGQHGEALAELARLAVDFPNDRDVLYLKAANERCVHQVPQALLTLAQLERQHPQFGLLYQERGFCHLAERDAVRASGAFARAVLANPGLQTSWSTLERLSKLLQRNRGAGPARLDYARVLIHHQMYARARSEVDALLAVDPDDRDAWLLQASVSAGLADSEGAIASYRRLLVAEPDSPELHVSLGHSLQAAGRQQEAIAAYRAAAAARPAFGDAYWSLANLKTYRFSAHEIECMQREESAAQTSDIDRHHFAFALGKALEDRGDYAASWRYYERGNALKRAHAHYDRAAHESDTRQLMELCTAQLFAERQGVGSPACDPIFIVGMPRSGSTLIEQILASHSEVDGTHELPDIPRIVSELRARGYPQVLGLLSSAQLRELGQRYLTDTRAYRRGRARFIDKMPNNFRHIGLIHLLLPGATLIDVRREPMACCFANFKQLFASGQEFSYDLGDLAHYYRNYLDLMDHWDEVLPGRVLHVQYENVVEDLEASVRRILAFCGLPFEPACLEFHKTARHVGTPSSEQVRQPLFRDGLAQWRRFEPWLTPLLEALVS